jgi:hypothetical protein
MLVNASDNTTNIPFHHPLYRTRLTMLEWAIHALVESHRVAVAWSVTIVYIAMVTTVTHLFVRVPHLRTMTSRILSNF